MKFNKFIYLIPVVLMSMAVLLLYQSSNKSTVEAKTNGQFQIVEVFAKNGFSPSVTEAKANRPTILKIITQNTLDCSGSIFIAKLKYQRFLPVTGETEIQILPQEKGSVITASCGMGMYGFEIRFV